MMSRDEIYLNAILTGDTSNLPTPISRVDEYLYQIVAKLQDLNFGYNLSIALAMQTGYNGYAGDWFVVSTNPTDQQYKEQTFEKLILLNSVTSIGNRAFYKCTSLTEITILSGVTFIRDGAFLGCTSLASITIPNSVTSIDEYAFYGCTKLQDVYFGGTQDQWAIITIGAGNECLTNANIHYNS